MSPLFNRNNSCFVCIVPLSESFPACYLYYIIINDLSKVQMLQFIELKSVEILSITDISMFVKVLLE